MDEKNFFTKKQWEELVARSNTLEPGESLEGEFLEYVVYDGAGNSRVISKFKENIASEGMGEIIQFPGIYNGDVKNFDVCEKYFTKNPNSSFSLIRNNFATLLGRMDSVMAKILKVEEERIEGKLYYDEFNRLYTYDQYGEKYYYRNSGGAYYLDKFDREYYKEYPLDNNGQICGPALAYFMGGKEKIYYLPQPQNPVVWIDGLIYPLDENGDIINEGREPITDEEIFFAARCSEMDLGPRR